MPLTFDKLREINVKRCEHYFHKLEDWSPAEWALSAAGEMGETCDAIKKRYVRKDGDVTLQDVADEIADTITYLDLLAASLGIDLGKAVVSKFNDVTLRMERKKHGDDPNQGFPKDDGTWTSFILPLL